MPTFEELLRALLTSGSPLVVPGILLVIQLAVYAYVKKLQPYSVLLRAIETSAFGAATASAAAIAQPTSRIYTVFQNSAVYAVLIMFVLWGAVIVGTTRLSKSTRDGRHVKRHHAVAGLLIGFAAYVLFGSGLDWARTPP